MADKRRDADGDERQPETPGKRRLEAVAALFGAIMAIGTVGIILWDEVRGSDRPPLIAVMSRGVYQHQDGFVLQVRAANRGDRTAAQVVVEGELRRGGVVAARSETTFDYVPSRSEREGGLFFAEDPRTYDVVLRAKGYIGP